ncbi:MAG: N-acetylmuramoyl-L-alanine amidase [Planctomycetes bacterium]|nr:N-acetylmuramoyl-L-alanine amidase [Planctomycetota bacterium]
MCSSCDSGPEGPSQAPAKPDLTRRGLILGGISLALAACVRGGGDKAGSGEGMWYNVQAGDSLTSLSKRSGLTIERIAEANSLESPALRPGSRLWLPGVRSLAPPPATAYQPPAPPKAAPKPAQPSTADGDHYEIVPRSAWTKEPVGANHVLMGKVERITVHHTDEHGGMDGKSDLEVVRMIERYHRGPEKRWAAIGYHFLVGKDGKIYEGRPVKYQGAHCGDNANNLGISVIGDCHHNLPNPRQMRALKAFLDDQRERFNVPLSRVYGHRDIKPTICPGDRLYGWLLDYNGKTGRGK